MVQWLVPLDQRAWVPIGWIMADCLWTSKPLGI